MVNVPHNCGPVSYCSASMTQLSEMKEHDSEAQGTETKELKSKLMTNKTIPISLSGMREFEYIETGLLLCNLDRIGEHG